MSYIVQRNHRFYVVAYDGIDPLSRRERRRWVPVGANRSEAEAIAARISADRVEPPPPKGGPVTFAEFLTHTWMPRKRSQVRATTGYRYAWMVDRYVIPAIGQIPLRRLRADHLDSFYENLAQTGGAGGAGLAPKTIHEVHLIVRAALDLAVERGLIARNVAQYSLARRRPPASPAARSWNPGELRAFLATARAQRLYPALHLAAHTGLRRGELVGLKWSDLDQSTRRLSISRTLQCVAGRPAEFGVKTRTSRRTVDLDHNTIAVLDHWRRRLRCDGLPHGPDDCIFLNHKGQFLNPESSSQLFDRIVAREGLPRIRFHDLRHTHASLLISAGTPIKVVSERLGHAHPGFTMHTYQHLLPGMSAAAAEQFATLIDAASR
jgi:integrase